MQMAISTCLSQTSDCSVPGTTYFCPYWSSPCPTVPLEDSLPEGRELFEAWDGAPRVPGDMDLPAAHIGSCSPHWQLLPIAAPASCSQAPGDVARVVDTEPLNFLPHLPSGLLACNRVFLFGGLRVLRLRTGFLRPLPLPPGTRFGGQGRRNSGLCPCSGRSP